MNGAFIGTVIAQSDLASGTRDGKDWTKKNYTIEDSGDRVTLTAWGENIGKVKVGCKYEFIGFWWKTYQEKIFLDFGNYGEVNLIGTDEVKQEPTKEEIMPDGKALKIPRFDDAGVITNIQDEATKLFMINQIVWKTIKDYQIDPNGGMIGQFTEIIYNKFFKANFQKASEQ